jgi:uncharacterized protein YyaL (SSP411 family)
MSRSFLQPAAVEWLPWGADAFARACRAQARAAVDRGRVVRLLPRDGSIRTMWDEERGGFFDRADEPDAVGLLRQRLKPFVPNCEAAQMLRRLAAVSGDNDLARRADATRTAIAPAAFDQDPLAAHYLLALGA